jgi:DNA-binding response OmpR family regulator
MVQARSFLSGVRAMTTLFADDDPVVRTLLGAVLGHLGHEAIGASEGAEAWGLYKQHRPTLVILDIEMPNHSGVELCRMIRQSDPQRETFILVLTGHDSEEALREVLDAGADDYMAKPASPENLVARLRIAERRIEQDRARRKVESDLQRARWLAGIGETTITLQHEINNPLSALLGHAELMLMDLRDAGADTQQAQVILDQAKRIAVVVRRLAELRDPKSVEYAAGARMIELTPREEK